MTVVLSLLGAMLVGMAGKDGPVCGVHTIRADDAALSLVSEAGCSFVVQLFDWSQIEPLPGEYFWEYQHSLARCS